MGRTSFTHSHIVSFAYAKPAELAVKVSRVPLVNLGQFEFLLSTAKAIKIYDFRFLNLGNLFWELFRHLLLLHFFLDQFRQSTVFNDFLRIPL